MGLFGPFIGRIRFLKNRMSNKSNKYVLFCIKWGTNGVQMPIYAHFQKNEHKRKKKKALNLGLFSLVAGGGLEPPTSGL